MTAEIDDEVTAINAIYGESTLSPAGTAGLYTLKFPSQPEISLRVEFPDDYPDAPPAVLGTETVGEQLAKGEGAYFVELVRDVLLEIYCPGMACISDLVEEVDSRLQQLGLDQESKAEEFQTHQAGGEQVGPGSGPLDSSDSAQLLEGLGEEPPWTLSEVIMEKKSVFVARTAIVQSTDQAKQYLAHLLITDKKVGKATHNITAWRIQGANGVQYQDCDDDGETAAGGRLLHLLELMNIWGAMVVVTR